MTLESNRRIFSVQVRVRRYASRGKYRGAEAYLLAELRSADLQAADRIFLWNELGMIYKYLGKFSVSHQLYRRTLRKIHECLPGPDRDFFLADLYHNLAGLEHARRHFRRAEKFARKGLQIRRRVASARSLPVAVDMAALAAVLVGQEKFAEAERLYRQALRTYRREYGLAHGETAILLGNLAALCQARHRFKRARDYYRRALKSKRRAFGATHPSVAITLNNLGMLCQAQGDPLGAEGCMSEALKILRRRVGCRHFQYRAIEKNYQSVLANAFCRRPFLTSTFGVRGASGEKTWTKRTSGQSRC